MSSKRMKSKEFVSTSDSEASDGGKKEKKKKSKKQKRETEDEDDSSTIWELGKKRKITINEFKGKKLIDIREYYEADDGTEKPGRKGISLTLDQWNKLKEVIPKVDKVLS